MEEAERLHHYWPWDRLFYLKARRSEALPSWLALPGHRLKAAQSEEVTDLEEEEGVLVLKAANFEWALEKFPHLLVEFYKWKKLEAGQKRAVCLKLQQKLTSESGAADIDGEDLFHEPELLPIVFNSDTTPLDVFNYIYSNNLTSVFPNLSISLRIYLTVPVTVAEGERSFSKLKLIKNDLRSTMSQERLSNLAMISIEKEVAIDTSDLIKDFAHRKARKVDFLGH
ncbi:hypothetical protein JRQ81_018794 [Phrynocephalus forsythii]|uniref:HAT C-terminal dimerisation domain-containing protein n=1 Tax=Phrynocephalus forsythii TaxID=171643 RepID=A0A9Q0XP80_9SAUR|nr:hypothetical protein JRQ81_018794 [Phrynocephalus forsythii]